MIGDVSTAFLHAPLPTEDKVYVIPPLLDRKPGLIWRMRKALYGLRQSLGHFQEYLAKVLGEEQYERPKADPQLCWHREPGPR
eukprot:9697172-Heterocapsa_arctica.AAC.1